MGARARVTLILARIGLAVASVGLVLVVAELVLRLSAGSPTAYRVLPANLALEFRPAPGAMPGISGLSHYSTTPRGIRGRPYSATGHPNILAVGGSTTECLYLDDQEAWPALLEKQISRSQATDAWVGNVGVAGLATPAHVLAARYYVPQLRLDLVLVLAGVNDLTPALRLGASYRAAAFEPDDYDKFLDRAFRHRPLFDQRIRRAFPKNTALFNLMEVVDANVERFEKSKLGDGDLLVEDMAGEVYNRRREALRDLPFTQLPDLSPAIERFHENLVDLATTIRAAGARPVLLTQPSIWYEGLSPAAEQTLWLAFLGETYHPRMRYRVADLANAMSTFNRMTLRVCQETGSDCIDLAAEMADALRESYYYDDVHLNERGSARVAEILAHRLAPLLDDHAAGIR